MNAREFESLARTVMSQHFGVELREAQPRDFPKRFDCVSPDMRVVGDAKYLTLVRGTRMPPAKFSMIAEHVWLLERLSAQSRFLVFGNQRRVPESWLAKYGHLVNSVEFYFLSDDGAPTRLR